MEDTIYSLAKTNPNYQALIVPPEEGGSEDDNYFGSIGDATQKHVNSLSSAQRQLWEGLWTSKSGTIFRFDQASTYNDPDPFSLSGEDLEEYFEKLKKTVKGGGITDESLAPLREAIQVEQERREKSEDLYDHAEPIPYHMLSEYPGMSRHAEIPAPPKDKAVYMGNTTQMFYDQYPEDHPDAKLINQALGKLNKDWDDIDEGFAEWFKNWIGTQYCREETRANFQWLVDKICEGKNDPIELTEMVLIGIDNAWRKDYQKKAELKTSTDSLLQLLKKNQMKWREEAKKGRTVFGVVKQFGQMLFKEFKGQMKPHHWSLYRSIKREHAPRVMVRGIDINRCGLSELHYVFEEKAKDVWFSRPYESVSSIRESGLLGKETFVDDEQAEEILNKMEKKASDGLRALEDIRKELIAAQREKVYGMINWSPIWAYYHLLKADLQIKEQHNG
jgi:hypothetical protein